MDTELIDRNNCAKTLSIVSPSEVGRYFSTFFAFERSSRERSRFKENWVSAFSKFFQHQFSDAIPFSSLCQLNTTLFLTQVRGMTNVGNLFENVWNDVLGHASTDQLEKLFRECVMMQCRLCNISGACDHLKQPPSKRKNGSESCRNLQ